MKEIILSIEDVNQIVQNRKEKMPVGSYVSSLLQQGVDRVAQKVGEEGVEVAIAATKMGLTKLGEDEVVGEIADLWFHSLVLLAKLDIPFIKIKEELTKRHLEKSLRGGENYE